MQNFQLSWVLSGSWWGKAIISLSLSLLSTFVGNKNFSNFRLCFMPRTTNSTSLMFMAIDDYILLGLTLAFFILFHETRHVQCFMYVNERKTIKEEGWKVINYWMKLFHEEENALQEKQSWRKWERDFVWDWIVLVGQLNEILCFLFSVKNCWWMRKIFYEQIYSFQGCFCVCFVF